MASLPTSSTLPKDVDQLAVDASITAWLKAGFPWSEMCSEEYDRIQIVVSQPDAFFQLCGKKPLHAGGKLYACSTDQYEFRFPVWVVNNNRVPLLVISALQPVEHQKHLIIHEMMHWLEKCSGKGIDFEHADMRVWEGVRVEAKNLYDRAVEVGRPAVRMACPWSGEHSSTADLHLISVENH